MEGSSVVKKNKWLYFGGNLNQKFGPVRNFAITQQIMNGLMNFMEDPGW